MIVTNDLNLPAPFVEAVRNDPYSDGGADISVTRLITPPQIVALSRAHQAERVEDASDRVWSLFGQAIHSILERCHVGGTIVSVEQRFFTDVLGWKVSGQVDVVERSEGFTTLSDYKVMSVWEGLNGIKREKVQQLNLLAHLMLVNGLSVDRLQVVAMYRDWSQSKAAYGQHPKRQVEVFDIDVWSRGDAEFEMRRLVQDHQAAAEGNIRPCTPEEQWSRPTTYAVMKEGRKSALRVLDSPEAAYDWASENGHTSGDDLRKGISIVERRGEKVRCQSYCPVRDFCPQYKRENAA